MYLYKLNLIDDELIIKSKLNFEDFTEMLYNTDRCLLDLVGVVFPTKVIINTGEIILIECLGKDEISKDLWEEIKTKNNSYLSQF